MLRNKRVRLVGVVLSVFVATLLAFHFIQMQPNLPILPDVMVLVLISIVYGTTAGSLFVFAFRTKAAWYLDEDVLLEGNTYGMKFYPNKAIQCGFDAQAYTEADVNKTLFYDLETAVTLLGDIPVIARRSQV